ncbi:MAG: DUF885 domain-containing protein [Planctomycetes bacterium]|nr:DUF885 domain-containing protein [Planctomycetota bacterium]
MPRRSIRFLVCTGVVACVLAVGADRPAAADEPAPRRDIDALVTAFSEDAQSLERAYGVPFSDAWGGREDAFLAAAAEELQSREWAGGVAGAGGRADAQPRPGQIDRTLLAEHIRHRRVTSAFDRRRLAELLVIAPFGTDLAALESSRRRLEPVAPRAAAERLEAAKKSVEDVRARVERGIGKKPDEIDKDALLASSAVANRTAARIDALRGVLRTWFDDRNGFEPEFAWWVRKPFEALDAALDGYAKFLREKVVLAKDDGGGPIVGDPIGEEALGEELAHEFIPYTPSEVLEIAEKQFRWCEDEAKRAAQEMGCGDDWKKALAKVKTETSDPGRQDELVAAQAKEAIEFVTSRDLVTVPQLCRDTWTLHMIPEAQQRTMPYAYYSGDGMGVAFPSSDMDHSRKLQSMRGNNVHFSRIVTPHELIPGHHLQLFQAARNRPYRELFRTPFLVEGWALYWEMRLWDLGWAKSPEDRIGMLFWRMHRCARIVVTMKFHLGKMTPDQMIEFLVDRVGHEKDGATAEVRRYVSGGYGPLYQAAYMLGGLQLRALQKELVGGGKMTERDFHDAVLRENSIPVRMIAASLRGEELTRAGPTPWRFAD